ncbi:hypothetical protein G7054_g13886 [Neopestalotiopsis clavispora]|nr:hypothetical protein G7054_g13886 [Neopestalotiopsis clavispora]
MAEDWDPVYAEDVGDFFEDDFDSDSFDGCYDGGVGIHITETSFEEKLRAARRTIKHQKNFNNSDVEDFFNDYGEIAGISSRNSGNLLHALVEIVEHNDEINVEDVAPLLRHLMARHLSLLKCPNKDNRTPIYMAIRASNDEIINCMVDACLTHGNDASTSPEALKVLDEALRVRGGRSGRTSLHCAFDENLKADTIRKLVENASDEALSEQDDLGKTPMHYAVQINTSFTLDRVELIDVFLRRDLRALHDNDSARPSKSETFLDIADNGGSSVYREHRTTRETATQRLIARTSRESAEKGAQTTEGALIQADVPAQPLYNHGDEHESGSRGSRMETATEKTQLSAYEHHQSKIGDEEEFPKQEKADEDGKGSQSGTEISRHEHRDDHDALGDVESTIPHSALNSRQPAMHTNGIIQSAEPFPNTSIKRTNIPRLDIKAAVEQQARRPSPSSERIDGTELRLNSDKVLMSLKLHYMRTRTAERAISFLHGTNMEDIQISFDYDRLPRHIEWRQFEARFGKDAKTHLKFDEVLQNVTFPYVEVQLTGRKADIQKKKEEKSGVRQFGILGRNDMKHFFDWLYAKGVRHIIRVTVQEATKAGEKVHSDKAIRESLERFVVEQLDWQKPDLDPETILHVGSKAPETLAHSTKNSKAVKLRADQQLKELFLRWGGSNAVLRAWSEPEGLANLPQLRRVYLYKPPIDQMSEDTQGIIRETGADDEHGMDAHEAPIMTTSDQGQGVNSHRWLNSAVRFAKEMRPFWDSTLAEFMRSRQQQGTPEHIEDDVVVALIDDGIDIFDTTHPDQILEGKSFDFHDGKVKPPFTSAGGNGTTMANMILRVCPMAKIYPIRLKTCKTPDGENQIDRDYAAQAVGAALEKKATIISMSWSLPMTHDGNTEEDKLHQALQNAVDSKVLMFCSAPDVGKFEEFEYPSGPWRNQMFRIGAAGADGRLFAYTPEQGITFALPGVDVVKDRGYKSSIRAAPGSDSTMTNLEYETGSGIATALAAGLAAMIIYCVKTSILAVMTVNQNKSVVGVAIPEDGATLIAEFEAMEQAFRSLGMVTSSNFIQIWESLDKVSEMLENARSGHQTAEEQRILTEKFVEFGTMLAMLAKLTKLSKRDYGQW